MAEGSDDGWVVVDDDDGWEEVSPPKSTLESVVSGASDFLTQGYKDEIIGGLRAGIDEIPQFLGLKEDVPFSQNYEKYRDEQRAWDKDSQASNPWAYFGGQVAGGAAVAASPVGRMLARSVGSSVPRAAGLGALEGGLYSSGRSEAQDVGSLAADTALGAGAGAVTGALGQKLINTLPGAAQRGGEIYEYLLDKFERGGKLAGTGARKLGSIASKVDDRHALRYLDRRDAVNAVDEETLIREAGGQIDDLKRGVSEARLDVRDAKTNKRVADRFLREELRGRELPDEAVESVTGALDKMRKITSQASSQAFDALEQSGHRIKLTPLKGELSRQINLFKINNAEPPKGTPGYDQLVYFRGYLDDLSEAGGKDISASDAKRFVQLLDDHLEDAYQKRATAGAKPSRGELALLGFRRAIDKKMRKIPKYRDVMERLAPETRLSKQANKFLERNPRTALKRLSSSDFKNQRQVVRQLDQRTGSRTLDELAEFEDAQRALRTPAEMRRRQEALPETAELVAAERALARASAEAGPASRINSPESLIRRSGNPNNFKEAQILEYLDRKRGQAGQPLLREGVDDLAAQRAFNADQSGGRGHRWAITGGIVGGLTAGPFGATAGAAAGAGVDKYGGQAFKAGLDLSMDYVKPAAHRVMSLLEEAPERLGTYAPILIERAQRGQASLGAAHHVLWKNNPGYRSMFTEDERPSEGLVEEEEDVPLNREDRFPADYQP